MKKETAWRIWEKAKEGFVRTDKDRMLLCFHQIRKLSLKSIINKINKGRNSITWEKFDKRSVASPILRTSKIFDCLDILLPLAEPRVPPRQVSSHEDETNRAGAGYDSPRKRPRWYPRSSLRSNTFIWDRAVARVT